MTDNALKSSKATMAWWVMVLSYMTTLALLAAIPIISPPSTDDTGAVIFGVLVSWLVMAFPLLIFAPWILKKSPYAASWLSYLSLLYFVLVMGLSTGIWTWLLSVTSIGIFLGSMMFTRWQKAGI